MRSGTQTFDGYGSATERAKWPLVRWFNNLKIRTKIVLLFVLGVLPITVGSIGYTAYNFYWSEVTTALGGLMNFVDAKQQGVIRFLGQNKKMAVELAALVDKIPPKVAAEHFANIVKTDVFSVEDHPFKDEIKSGKRKIPTFSVYQAIDYVENGVITISSDPSRIGKPEPKVNLTQGGYSDVWKDGEKYYLTFPAMAGKGKVLVHADALMLTNIVNGEIGNLEAKTGAFYLAGVGKTFDYYIVDSSNRMITESRVIPNAMLHASGSAEPWRITLQQAGVICSAAGTYVTNGQCKTGCREAMGFYTGVAGTTMLGVSMPFYDSSWTIVVEQEASELLGPLYQLIATVVIGVLMLLSAMILAGIYLASTISRPLSAIPVAMHRLAEGDPAVTVGDTTRTDEVGEMNRALQAFKATVVERQKLQAERESERANRENRATRLESLVTQFQSSMTEIVRGVSAGAKEMHINADKLSAIAEKTNAEAGMVASASGSATSSVATVADAAAELSGSITEINRQITHSSQMANQAVADVARTNQTVESLNAAAKKIGTVVGLISDIAAQTNLLALNATIEAARAGESGKGFAVVASEVKHLADQTAKATEEIAAQVTEMQGVTSGAVSAIEGIGKTIVGINTTVTAIAAAAEEQSAATGEISRSVQAAASNTKDVSTTIQAVTVAVGETNRMAEGVLSASSQLSGQAERLREQVDSFIKDVRAA